MKIYIVTQGEYSDYHIEAVFLDEKKAQTYCATRLHGEPCYIEEYDPHDSDIDAPDCNPVCCAVGCIWDDGRIELDYAYEIGEFEDKFGREILTYRDCMTGALKGRTKYKCCLGEYVEPGIAKKIIADRYAKWKETVNEFWMPKKMRE